MDLHHSTTTLDRIVQAYDRQWQILESSHPWADHDVRELCADIRAEIDALYSQKRAEEVFAAHGPPRMIADLRSMPQARGGRPSRQVAHGMAPLPRGGE